MNDQSLKTKQRRAVEIGDVESISTEADRLLRGGYRAVGNWSLGQASAHLAILMECSLDGFAFGLPRVVQWVGSVLKKRMLRRGFPRGLKFPGSAKATLTPPDVVDSVGVERLRHAVHRLQSEPQRYPSPVLGPMSVEEWNLFHQRHAELHLSFLLPSE